MPEYTADTRRYSSVLVLLLNGEIRLALLAGRAAEQIAENLKWKIDKFWKAS